MRANRIIIISSFFVAILSAFIGFAAMAGVLVAPSNPPLPTNPPLPAGVGLPGPDGGGLGGGGACPGFCGCLKGIWHCGCNIGGACGVDGGSGISCDQCTQNVTAYNTDDHDPGCLNNTPGNIAFSFDIVYELLYTPSCYPSLQKPGSLLSTFHLICTSQYGKNACVYSVQLAQRFCESITDTDGSNPIGATTWNIMCGVVAQ